ncbi:hypothetical protein [Actinoplanes sp. URMC 104]|uniref:hypothetical protein n=1 Tax=Actinoplanes sp. URMC 104 TaxID=3423409 RepID=UPI003F1AB35C
MKHYPPARIIHELACRSAPPGLPILPMAAFRDSHDIAHDCVTRATALNNRPVVAEPADYGPHVYSPSGERPADATRALCAVCHGTHTP